MRVPIPAAGKMAVILVIEFGMRALDNAAAVSQGIEFTLSQAGVEICAGLKSTQKERGYAMT